MLMGGRCRRGILRRDRLVRMGVRMLVFPVRMAVVVVREPGVLGLGRPMGVRRVAIGVRMLSGWRDHASHQQRQR